MRLVVGVVCIAKIRQKFPFEKQQEAFSTKGKKLELAQKVLWLVFQSLQKKILIFWLSKVCKKNTILDFQLSKLTKKKSNSCFLAFKDCKTKIKQLFFQLSKVCKKKSLCFSFQRLQKKIYDCCFFCFPKFAKKNSSCLSFKVCKNIKSLLCSFQSFQKKIKSLIFCFQSLQKCFLAFKI